MYTSIVETFTDLFDGTPVLFQSPGRINLIGEHTDYNGGFVMPVAIDRGIRFAIAPSTNGKSTAYSVMYDESFDFDIKNPVKVQSPLWTNYLSGVLKRLNDLGLRVRDFNCVIDGNLPTGAGLSSSAALECGFVFALNTLFDLAISKIDMVHIAQWAEHNFAGVNCGIMDQFASVMGKGGNAMLLDCRSLEVQYLPLALKDHDLLLCDTGVKHSLGSSEYNTRRKECEAGVAILKQISPEIQMLRDVPQALVIENKRLFPPNVYDRCLYITGEIQRVLDASEDLRQNRIAEFGIKMYETHEGLSKQYAVSCAELDFLVEEARRQSVVGARMIGGGFGGCTLNVIRKNKVADFISETSAHYRDKFGIGMTTYAVAVAGGSSRVSENIPLQHEI